MSNRSLSGAGHSVRRRTRHRSWALRLGTAVFVVGAICALLITLSGARALLDQLNDAPDGSSHLITLIIGSGLVVLGPVLLAALAVLMPHHWLPEVFERISDAFTGERAKHNHPQASR